MAHKSSPKRRKKAKQIEKSLDKIAGFLLESRKENSFAITATRLWKFGLTPKLRRIINEALEQSKNYDAKVLPIVLVLSKLGLLKARWLI